MVPQVTFSFFGKVRSTFKANKTNKIHGAYPRDFIKILSLIPQLLHIHQFL